MLVLNKKFYSRKKDLEQKGENIFSKASKNISTIAPIIFSVILGPTVVVSSIMSQAAFLMIANILLSIGLSLAFFNRIYQGNAKFLEIFLTLGIITALFFLVLYLSPVITGWDILGVISFINLFASSINSFFLLRTIVLPPVLACIKIILGKVGINVEIHLDKHRDFEAEIDVEREKRSDPAASTLLIKNYHGYATAENLQDNDWRKKAILPYTRSKEIIYGYATRYRSMPFGEINNHEKIAECLKQADNIMLKAATDGSHNVLLYNKLVWKSEKVKLMSDDIEKLTINYDNYSAQEKKSFINKRFIYIKNGESATKELFVKSLETNVNIQLNKIVKLLQCYPLHIAIDYLEHRLNIYLSEAQRAVVRNKIATDEMCALYSVENLTRMGLRA